MSIIFNTIYEYNDFEIQKAQNKLFVLSLFQKSPAITRHLPQTRTTLINKALVAIASQHLRCIDRQFARGQVDLLDEDIDEVQQRLIFTWPVLQLPDRRPPRSSHLP